MWVSHWSPQSIAERTAWAPAAPRSGEWSPLEGICPTRCSGARAGPEGCSCVFILRVSAPRQLPVSPTNASEPSFLPRYRHNLEDSSPLRSRHK